MKIRIPVIVKDVDVTQYKGVLPTEYITFDKEKFVLDGPVSQKIAVLDFNENDGKLEAGADFIPPDKKNKFGKFNIQNEHTLKDFNSPELKAVLNQRDFQQVNVFGTVLRTMNMFEEEDVLGRPLTWAFNSPQLLIVPRAGEWENAFYERESHSLQFFYFYLGQDPVYTCLSHDIISHETAHAILDGIAPDLYNAITPQSLALHEAIADLTALVMAFRSRDLAVAVLEATNGKINNSSVFSGMAEQFQNARDPNGREFLRNLANQKTLDPNDTSLDKDGKPNLVSRNEPHELSEVLTGALYSVFLQMFDKLKKEKLKDKTKSRKQNIFLAFWIAAERFKRMIFRALDYLPPGEISFADYGRAIIAADQASYAKENTGRELIKKEFLKRGIVSDIKELDVQTDFVYEPLNKIDLEAMTLENSDWAAYQFVEQNRQFFGVPEEIRFRVFPRLDTTKLYYKENKTEKRIRECIFKVSWDVQEENQKNTRLVKKRQITVGTTLAVEWETKKVRALLTSDKNDKQREDRDSMLEKLLDDGTLRVGDEAKGAGGRWLQTAIRGEVSNDVMRVRSSARMLHIAANR